VEVKDYHRPKDTDFLISANEVAFSARIRMTTSCVGSSSVVPAPKPAAATRLLATSRNG